RRTVPPTLVWGTAVRPRRLQRRRCRRSYAPLALPPPRPRTIARETPFRQQHAAFSVIRRTLFLLEAVCARSRVAGRGATDDIIHREHDVFNSGLARIRQGRSLPNARSDPCNPSIDDARHLVTLRTSASVHARLEENHVLFHNPSGSAWCARGVRANVRRPTWRIHPDRPQRCVRG